MQVELNNFAKHKFRCKFEMIFWNFTIDFSFSFSIFIFRVQFDASAANS